MHNGRQPQKSNHVVGFDTAANGDFLTWVVDRIRSRLPNLLRQTTGLGLADTIDTDTIAKASIAVEAHLRRRELQLEAGR